MTVDEDPGEPGECSRCFSSYMPRDMGDDGSPFLCDPCAQEEVITLRAEVERLRKLPSEPMCTVRAATELAQKAVLEERERCVDVVEAERRRTARIATRYKSGRVESLAQVIGLIKSGEQP